VGLVFLTGLTQLSRRPDDRLFEINLFVGSATLFLGLGGFLVYQAASALGGAGSSAFARRVPWPLAALFPVAIAIGQLQANEPTRAPWLFPFVNLVVVGVPSLLVAWVAITRYAARNPLAWPVSWREAMSSFTWGAIGATSIGGLINSVYLVLAAAFVIDVAGRGSGRLGCARQRVVVGNLAAQRVVTRRFAGANLPDAGDGASPGRRRSTGPVRDARSGGRLEYSLR
jgi:hypothetical protein